MLRTYDLAGTAEIIITLAQDLGSESLRFCAVVALAFHGGLKNQIGATNPNVDTRNADIVKKKK